MPEPGQPAEEVHHPVAAHQQHIADVPDMGQPSEVLNHSVEFVTMHHQNPSPVGRGVHRVFLKRHAGVFPMEAGQKLVVVAGNINDFCSLAAFAEELLNDVVVLLRPVDAAPQRPDVNQIPDQVKSIELRIAQEFEQGGGLASPRAEVNVGNPAGAVSRAHAGSPE